MSDSELECFKEWETELLRQSSFYDGEVEPDEGIQRQRRICEYTIEEWELKAIDGKGPSPAIPLGQVRRNNTAKFRLQEKYKGLYFIDKDPDGRRYVSWTTYAHIPCINCNPALHHYKGVHGYYDDDTEDNAAPADQWENRKILGLAWQNFSGFRLETKLCDDLTGATTNYLINASMIRMIKESKLNRKIQLRSDIE